MGKQYHHQSSFGPGRRVPLRHDERSQFLAAVLLDRRPGRLTPCCVILARVLATMQGADGQLDASHETLAALCGVSASTVKACCRRMRERGFLDWERRLVRVPDPGSATGWRTQQASNAYVLLIPARVEPRDSPDNAESEFRPRVPMLCFKKARSRIENVAVEQAIADANRDRQLRMLLGLQAPRTG